MNQSNWSLDIQKIHLPLKVVWKLSRNTSTFKDNFIITLTISGMKFQSEVAPNIRYGETPDKIEKEFADFKHELNSLDHFLAHLDRLIASHSLRFALESAYLSYLAAQEKKSLSQYLGLPKPKLQAATSYTMPIMEVGEIQAYLKTCERFHSLKIKVNSETGIEMLNEVVKHSQQKLRIDGNEAWSDLDTYKKFEEQCLKFKEQVEFIEQPFPASLKQCYLDLHKTTPFIIMADESIEDHDNLEELKNSFGAVNIKLMKTGSLLKARDFLVKAHALKLKTMVGCMIETSLGISYAYEFSGLVDYLDLDGFLLIQKDPFSLMTEEKGMVQLNN